MATVHLGRQLGDAGFGRVVAIKRMHPHLAKQSEFVEMFLDEARIVARIRHPNIVPTLDVVVERDELLLVMEYVEGESLAKLLGLARKQAEPPSMALLAAIMVGVLRGLHAAHEARDPEGAPLGLVHRDVSPQNILVGADGVPRVLDFGIAKARGRSQQTQEGQLKGKPAYMAPEQLLGEVVDRRTDVFAASIVFWETLTGKRLFRGENEIEAMRLVLERYVDPPSRVGAISAELDEIVLRGLDRDPTARWQDAREMAAAIESATRCATASELEAWVRSLVGPALVQRAEELLAVESFAGEIAPSATPPAPLSTPHEAPAPTLTEGLSAPTTTRLEAPAEARVRALRIVAAGALVVLLAAGALLAFQRASPPPEERSADAAAAGSASTGAPAASFPSATASASTVASVPASPPSAGPPQKPPTPAGGPTTRPPAATNGCQPPYTVDARGIKHPKPACYR